MPFIVATRTISFKEKGFFFKDLLTRFHCGWFYVVCLNTWGTQFANCTSQAYAWGGNVEKIQL